LDTNLHPSSSNSDNELEENLQNLMFEEEDEDPFQIGENNEIVVDTEDLPEGYNPHTTHSEGSACGVEGCKGLLKPNLNSKGQLMYFQCQLCAALFTNYPGT